MKKIFGLILFFVLSFSSPVVAQVFTTLYLPTAGSGLTLNIAAGRVFCAGSMATYSAGTLTMTASLTNYVYLNAASSCVPAVKSTAFTIGDIPIATVVAGSSAITSVTDNRTMFNQGGSGSSGVLSINSTAGAFTFTGSGVSCVGTTCTFSGSSSSSVQYNPSNTAITFSGDSEVGDDEGVLGTSVPVTSWSISAGVCSFVGTNTFAIGDWFATNNITGWPSTPSSFALWSTGYMLFQVSSTGLSTSGWQAACPLLSTASGTGGNAETANYFLPFLTSKLPFLNGHGVINVKLPVNASYASLASNFSAVIGAAPTNPAYLVLVGGVNDISACGSAATLEGYLTSIWSQAHSNGWTVVQSTMVPVAFNSILCSSIWTTFNSVNAWMRGQGPSNANNSSTQHWDRMVDGYTALSNYGDTNLRQSNGYLAAGGIAVLANVINESFSAQGGIVPASFINPTLITPNIGDASGNSLYLGDTLTTGDNNADPAMVIGTSGHSSASRTLKFTMVPVSTPSYGYQQYGLDGFFHFTGSYGGNGGINTPYLTGMSTAPSGSCSSILGGTWALTIDGVITHCPSGGGTWATYGNTTATNLASGALGSVPYQSAASTTTFLASPTTSGHTYFLGWQPSGSAIAPTAVDLGTYLGANVTGTSPIVATPTTSGVSFGCPTCGTSSGGTNVSQNSGSTETNLPLTGYMPQVCSDTSGSGTAQSCTVANSFTPQAGNCVVYKTTTANSGTGLTVSINSLGAKSVAVASSTGWTTTLVAGSSIPANAPMNLCYNGTNWDASGTGYAASGGSSSAYPAWQFNDFVVGITGFTSSGAGGSFAASSVAGTIGSATMISGATLNNWRSFAWQDATSSQPIYLSNTAGTFKLAASLQNQNAVSTNMTIAVGLGNNGGTSSWSAPNPADEITWHCDSQLENTNWRAFQFHSSVRVTDVDSGVSCTTSAFHQIQINIVNGAITWYLDGVSVATGTVQSGVTAWVFGGATWNHATVTVPVVLDWVAYANNTGVVFQ